MAYSPPATRIPCRLTGMTPEQIQHISNLLSDAACDVRNDSTDIGSAIGSVKEALAMMQELDMRNISAIHHG